MVRAPHHDPEHGRRVRVAVRRAHRPEEDRGEDAPKPRTWNLFDRPENRVFQYRLR